jgi:spore coat polysaccharide biosynthesis predicted glycosyltransferase SpsG
MGLLGAVLESRSGELFAIATVFDEILFQASDLLVQQIIRLVDQADDGIGADFGVIVFEPSGIEIPALVIGEFDHFSATDCPVSHLPSFIAVSVPELQASVAEEILEIQKQFFQA